jgi:hypothetical protein
MTRRRVLNTDQVKEIRAAYKPHVIGYLTLARRYGVGASTIRDVVKYWSRA